MRTQKRKVSCLKSPNKEVAELRAESRGLAAWSACFLPGLALLGSNPGERQGMAATKGMGEAEPGDSCSLRIPQGWPRAWQ